jgi:hypothetical protein
MLAIDPKAPAALLSELATPDSPGTEAPAIPAISFNFEAASPRPPNGPPPAPDVSTPM